MGAASRRKKSNKKNNPVSNDKKMCTGAKGNKSGKRNNKGNPSISEEVQIPQKENQSHGDKPVDSSPAIDHCNEPVDDSYSQSGVSVPEVAQNDKISDAASIPETPDKNIFSSHNSEVNRSNEQEEDVLSTNITNNGSISEVHSPELGVSDVTDHISPGSNNGYEQGIALLSSPKYVEEENRESHALTIEQNNLCCLTISPSHTVSEFVELEEIKEMDETSQIHLRNPIDRYAMLKPGLSEVDDANPCVENSVIFKNNQAKGGGEEYVVSPSTHASLKISEAGTHEKSDGADDFAEFQPLIEQVDMKIEKATWKSCCGLLFSLSIR